MRGKTRDDHMQAGFPMTSMDQTHAESSGRHKPADMDGLNIRDGTEVKGVPTSFGSTLELPV